MRKIGPIAAGASSVSGVYIAPGGDRRAKRSARAASRELKRRYSSLVTGIEALEPHLEGVGIDLLRSRFIGASEHLRRAAGPAPDNVTSPDPLAEAFAIVRELARRLLGLRAFRSQLIAGLAVYDAHVAELPTGEGKTLAAVPAACVHAAAGRRVHVLTVNDYLARRDAEWMGPLYTALGLRVGAVQESMSIHDRQAAYAADVTYATANEAGFDFLRDHLATAADEIVQRSLDTVIVDELDSILIDEARIPLVVAGGESAPAANAYRAANIVRTLAEDHYVIDPDARTAALTSQGIETVRSRLQDEPSRDALMDAVHLALQARTFAGRDVDYIVRDGRIELVDAFKGRVVQLRRWPDGFHAAVEAKEGLALTAGAHVLSSITLQSFIRLYTRVSGMTATAATSAQELMQGYGLHVVVIPPNQPCVRADLADMVFGNRSSKHDALLAEIAAVHAARRPVLVGTESVAESEAIAGRLRAMDIACTVLNARDDEEEAAVVAQAGAPGAVTISTNMAGRGTDIRLGGADASHRDEVVAAGGLYVIGTNRHEARRIDLQLRGRAGRQGDPGLSRLFVSLEDDLIRRYKLGDLLGESEILEPRDGIIDDRKLRAQIEKAQELVDWMNFKIRSELDRYTSVVERHRREIHGWREDVIRGRGLLTLLERECPEQCDEIRRVAGDDGLTSIARDVTLHHIDAGWASHLAEMRERREGIRRQSLQSAQALVSFRREVDLVFNRRLESVRAGIVEAFRALTPTEEGLLEASRRLVRPTAKWTYLLSETPMRSEHYRDLDVLRAVLRDGMRPYSEAERSVGSG